MFSLGLVHHAGKLLKVPGQSSQDTLKFYNKMNFTRQSSEILTLFVEDNRLVFALHIVLLFIKAACSFSLALIL
jgi:hypothetical protein